MPDCCAIEICDAGVALVDATGLRIESPGFALLQRREVLTGAAARAQARRYPRQVHHRFWEALDQQPLARPHREAHSHADLAYHHLRALWQAADAAYDEVLMAVPADYSRDQLALLLGIAGACGISVTGLVVAPLASAAAEGEGERLLLDIQLHRVLAHRISLRDGQLALAGSRALSEQGLLALEDSWAAMLERCFVEQARFNPLHEADSEQRLYDSLPQWWTAPMQDGRQQLAFPAGQRDYRISLDPRAWRDAAAGCYAALRDAVAQAGDDTGILVTHRLAALPGLLPELREAATGGLSVLEAGAAARAALAQAGRIRSEPEAPLLVTALPAAAAPAPVAGTRSPTHLLWGHEAWPLAQQPLELDGGPPRPAAGGGCRIRRDGEGVWLEIAQGSSVRRNGEPVHGTLRLQAGDALEVAGRAEPYRLIAEVAADGPQAA